ncbi:hypothetical protein V5O48_016994, partial [Marasmius crinis-equi]
MPDKFTFKRRFVDGLPQHLIKEMINNGASPDYSDIETMIRAIQKHEDEAAMTKYYLKRKQQRPSTHSNATNNQNRERTGSQNTTHRSGPPNNAAPARVIDGRRYKFVRRSRSPNGNKERTPNHRPGSGFKFNNQKASTSQQKDGNKLPTKQEAEQKKLCFNCGDPGHFANDPKCRRYGMPRLFVISEEELDLELENNAEEASPEPQDQTEDHSEDVSSEGEYFLEEYEDYGGYINDDGSDYDDQLGQINEITNPHILLDDYYNPLEGSGPPVVIEEEGEM